MSEPGFTLFDTPIGRCGIAWSDQGVVGIWLPGARRRSTPAGAPPPEIQQAIQAITAMLSGSPADLSTIRLDMGDVAEFERHVYEQARTIPRGSTRTYGAIATALGDPRLARDVGQALGKNPFPIVVPCHRVVAANGQAGGFSAPGGRKTKLRLLALEHTSPNGTLPLFRD